jgi:hypothetical protein
MVAGGRPVRGTDATKYELKLQATLYSNEQQSGAEMHKIS